MFVLSVIVLMNYCASLFVREGFSKKNDGQVKGEKKMVGVLRIG